MGKLKSSLLAQVGINISKVAIEKCDITECA